MIRYAEVVSTNGQEYYVKFFGEITQSSVIYPKVGIYTPKEGDTVAFIKDELGKYFCLGSVNPY